jgi:hypothetical protein
VPPSRRTFLIIRPRTLSFDLLVLAEAQGFAFREFDSEQAGRAADALFDALCHWSNGDVKIEQAAEAAANGESPGGLYLRVHIGPFHLIACERRPGHAYAPLRFADAAGVSRAANQLTEMLCPPGGIEQEFYLNTRHFQR